MAHERQNAVLDLSKAIEAGLCSPRKRCCRGGISQLSNSRPIFIKEQYIPGYRTSVGRAFIGRRRSLSGAAAAEMHKRCAGAV